MPNIKKLNMFLKLPEDLIQLIKIRAVKENKTYSKLVEELLRRMLNEAN